MDGFVLAVRAGSRPVRGLTQPIKLTFKRNEQVRPAVRALHLENATICFPLILNMLLNMFQGEKGTCVFWQESELEDGTGGLHMPAYSISALE